MLNTRLDLMIEFDHSFNVPHVIFHVSRVYFFNFFFLFCFGFFFLCVGFFRFQDKTRKMGGRNRVSRVDRKEAGRLCQNVFQKNISRSNKMSREKLPPPPPPLPPLQKKKKDQKEEKNEKIK